MSWKTSFAVASLVSVSVFIWLTGNLIEQAFGIHGLVISYGLLSITLGVFMYVMLQWIEGVVVSRASDGQKGEDNRMKKNTDHNFSDKQVEKELNQLHGSDSMQKPHPQGSGSEEPRD